MPLPYKVQVHIFWKNAWSNSSLYATNDRSRRTNARATQEVRGQVRPRVLQQGKKAETSKKRLQKKLSTRYGAHVNVYLVYIYIYRTCECTTRKITSITSRTNWSRLRTAPQAAWVPRTWYISKVYRSILNYFVIRIFFVLISACRPCCLCYCYVSCTAVVLLTAVASISALLPPKNHQRCDYKVDNLILFFSNE